MFIFLCIGMIYIVFGDFVFFYVIVIVVFMVLVFSIMGVRVLGEIDLNFVLGISKLV